MVFLIKRFLKQLLIFSFFTPIALLWMLKALLIDWIASRWSFLKLSKVASEIGLEHIKSNYIKEFGELKGMINGHKILVRPFYSMNPVIRTAYKNTHKGLELSFRKPIIRPEKNVVDFKTSDWKFNRTFKTVRAHKDKVTDIKNNKELFKLIVSFYSKWIFQLESLSFGENDIYCSLRYGFNIFPYIPVSKLETLVKDLYILAEKIDSSLNGLNEIDVD